MEDQEVARQVHGTFQSEWQRSNRVTRTFTELGFAKARLPEDLYASIQTYYYNNQHHLAKEEWNNKGVYVNWWEVQVSLDEIQGSVSLYCWHLMSCGVLPSYSIISLAQHIKTN